MVTGDKGICVYVTVDSNYVITFQTIIFGTCKPEELESELLIIVTLIPIFIRPPAILFYNIYLQYQHVMIN